MSWILAHLHNSNEINHIYRITGYDDCCGYMEVEPTAICGYPRPSLLIMDSLNQNGICDICNSFLIMVELSK